MSKIFYKNLTFEELIKTDIIQRNLLFSFSCFGIILYVLSVLIILLYLKKIELFKSKPLLFILLNSITNLFDLKINIKIIHSFKHIILYISSLFQIHFILSYINYLLSGHQIFISEKDFSTNLLLFFEIIIALIIFPYAEYYENINKIHFFQYLSIIILMICFYEYIKYKINKVINYLKDNKKENITLSYSEPEEIIRIYTLTIRVCHINFVLFLIFYILKFFDILLIKIEKIHYILTIIFILIKITIAFSFFIVFIFIAYLLQSYKKGEIVQTNDEENNLVAVEKLGIEVDDEENGQINKEEEKNNEDKDINDSENIKKKDGNKNIENFKKEDNNVLEVKNSDVSNEKETKNNEEEEKLDDEEETLKLNHISQENDK